MTIRSALFLGLFFLSGAAGLIHQVTWSRLLELVFGVTVYAVSTVLACFFAGLSLGSAVLGRWLDRRPDGIGAFVWMELGIGLYALAIPKLLDGVEAVFVATAGGGALDRGSAVALQCGLCLAVLLPPTFLMGGTLPAMVKTLSVRRIALGRSLSTAYGSNTAGAALGALLAGFVLLPRAGVQATIVVAALLNMSAALAAAWLVRGEPVTANAKQDEPRSPGPPARTPIRTRAGLRPALLGGALLAGATGLACEVLWTRALVFFLGYSVYAFSSMLATFLAGIALGGWFASTYADRLRRPRLVLGFVQAGVGAAMAGSILVFHELPTAIRWIYGDATEIDFRQLMAGKFAASALVMLPPTLLMGMAFPLFVQAFVRAGAIRARGLASDVGTLTSVNTAGGIAGSVLAGFVLVERHGIVGSLVGIGLASVLWGVAFIAFFGEGGVGRRLAAVSLVLAVGLLPVRALSTAAPLIANVVDPELTRILSYEEGIDVSASVIERGSSRQLAINSTVVSAHDPNAWSPSIDLVNSHLPMLLRPDAKRALVMGVGAGLTVGGFTAYPLESITAVELSEVVLEATSWFDDANRHAFRDPRVEVVLNDARNHLLLTDERYDVIVNEAYLSAVTGATALTSREFFGLVREHLTERGVYSAGPGLLDPYFENEIRTLLSVFEHVSLFAFPNTGCFFAIASKTPVSLDLAAHEALSRLPTVRDAWDELNVRDPLDLYATYVMGTEGLRAFVGPGPVNTDDLPYSAYDVVSTLGLDLFRPLHFEPRPAEIATLLEVREPVEPLVQRNALDPGILDELGRRRAVMAELLYGRFVAPDGPTAAAHYREALRLDPTHPMALGLAGDLGIVP